MTVLAEEMVTLSTVAGTPAGFQMDGLFQFPDATVVFVVAFEI